MSTINTVNPYANNDQLSSLEQEVLWEYAKLGNKIKRISNLAKLTAESPNESLLAELRTLEKKMGLVLTLFKASVWGVAQDAQAAAEAEQLRSAEEDERRYQSQMEFQDGAHGHDQDHDQDHGQGEGGWGQEGDSY